MNTTRVSTLSGALLAVWTLAACTTSNPANPTPTPVQPTRTPRPTPTSTPTSHTAWSSASPEGAWIAEGFMEGPWMQGEDEVYRTTLTVRSAISDAVWPVIDQTSHYGLGYTTPAVVLWSADGLRMYFTNSPIPDGCAPFVVGSDLLVLDLTTGSVTEVLPSGLSSSFALSPDEATLAYVGRQEGWVFVLRDLTSGDERQVELPVEADAQAGNLTWSSAGDALLLAIAHQACLTDWTHSIVWIDAATLAVRTLADHDMRRFTILSWVPPMLPLLADESGMLWFVDPANGRITDAVRP
jgi:hypothetical protein